MKTLSKDFLLFLVSDLQWTGAASWETGPSQWHQHGGLCHGCVQKPLSWQGDSS